MSVCEVCGRTNRPGARFCRYCASVLPVSHQTDASTPGAQPRVITRPTEEDERWLAATLVPGESSSSVSPQPARCLAAFAGLPSDHQEEVMDQPQPTPIRFGGRYEVIAEGEHGEVEVVDHEPWRQCWACGSTANQPDDAFCTNCGAALERRSYRGSISPINAPDALALITTVDDTFARAILPPISDHLEADGRLLVLLAQRGHSPLELPLDELTALRIGAGLTRLLTILHQYDIALGSVQAADLGMTIEGEPRLLRTPDLHRLPEDSTRAEAIRGDIQALAGLLEALTATPRTTQRLDEMGQLVEEVPAAENQATFASLLRQLRTQALENTHDLAARFDALIYEYTRPRPLRQRIGASSDTGMVRDHNEDSLLFMNLSLNTSSADHTRGLYIVADGMGGHAAGEVASSLAVRGAAELILKEYMALMLDPDAEYVAQQTQDMLHRSVLHANNAVRRAGQSRGNDMGTTMTLALVFGDRAVIANVGDSRTYLYRDGKLRRISKDHSLVMRLVELGQLTDEEIYTHPQRNAVLRSLGDQADVEVDLFEEMLRPGDALLLCSDGQWEMTHDPEIEQILQKHADPQAACDELIKAANQAGGEDNVTSILVRFEAV